MTVGAYESLWIGSRPRRLYAALHRPPQPTSSLAMLLAPPLLHELPRARRLLTEIATSLAEQGIACLRFDFFGSGDSEGDGEQLDFASMRGDLEAAAHALRAWTGAARVGVLALRGACLPVLSWARDGGDASPVVLWEPVLDGPAWLRELERLDAAERASESRYPLRRGAAVLPVDEQLMGYPASSRLRADLAAADMACMGGLLRVPVWAVSKQVPDLLPKARVLPLPEDTPSIGGAARMDVSVFMTAGLQRSVDALAQALLAEASPEER